MLVTAIPVKNPASAPHGNTYRQDTMSTGVLALLEDATQMGLAQPARPDCKTVADYPPRVRIRNRMDDSMDVSRSRAGRERRDTRPEEKNKGRASGVSRLTRP